MTLELGTTAPDFTAASTQGELALHDWLGDSWGVLFSHPRDFSGVCLTELTSFVKHAGEFEARSVKLAALAVVPLERRTAWLEDLSAFAGAPVPFPLIADPEGTLAGRFGMLHPDHAPGVACRGFVVIDPKKTIRMFAMYPITVGRDVGEILRIVDSLQFTARHGLVTPANWRPGEAGVIPPAIDDDAAREKFPEGWDGPTPYLRLVDR